MATAKPGIRVEIDQNKHFCYQGSFLKRVRCAELGEAPKTGALPGAAFPRGCGPAARSVPEIWPERWARISTEFLTGLWKGIQRTRRGRHLAKAHSRHRAPCRPHAPPAHLLHPGPQPEHQASSTMTRPCGWAQGVLGGQRGPRAGKVTSGGGCGVVGLGRAGNLPGGSRSNEREGSTRPRAVTHTQGPPRPNQTPSRTLRALRTS